MPWTKPLISKAFQSIRNKTERINNKTSNTTITKTLFSMSLFTFNSTYADLEAKCGGLEQTVADLGRKIATLQAKNAGLLEGNADLDKKNTANKHRVNVLRASQKTLLKENDGLKAEVARMKKEHAERASKALSTRSALEGALTAANAKNMSLSKAAKAAGR